MRISELETPALLIDLNIMERNLARVAEYARSHGLRLRPHTKTHKTPAIGRKQMEAGAAGLTVAKVGEAEVMLAADPGDLLVAYPVIGQSKLHRLCQVAKKTPVTVAIDSHAALRQIADAAREHQVEIGVLAEADVGLHRVGVGGFQPLLDLVKGIAKFPRLRWEGISFYPGHIKLIDDGGREQIGELSRLVESLVDRLRAAGAEPQIVSGGSTPALFFSHQVAGLNEIRPGTYVFNDRNTVECGACSWDDCAASILVTVVSNARPGQVIIDGGSKTFSSDRVSATGEATFGRILGLEAASFHKMNEEHGFVDVSKTDARLEVGDRLRIIPNHICVAVNLHEQIYGVRGDVVEQIWKVEGRGKLS
jgi:D-serine deaminase-like pyridoxal phosphate-dependent protein